MPASKLHVQLSQKVDDLKNVRLAGAAKSIDQMTVAELVSMRPGGGGEAADSYSVNAFTDNVSVSTSSLVEQVGQIAKERAMRAEIEEVKLRDIRGKLGNIGNIARPGG